MGEKEKMVKTGEAYYDQLSVGITLSTLSILKNGKAKAIRIETLNAICAAFNCQPGDILEYRDERDSAC